MQDGNQSTGSEQEDREAIAANLKCKVGGEIDAAKGAACVEMILIHLDRAAAYAQRLAQCSAEAPAFTDKSWADQHRIW